MNLPNTENNLWIIIRDLDKMSNPNEKVSESKGNWTWYNNFNKLVQNNNLIDLGYRGNPFTWYNKMKIESAIFAILSCFC